MAQKLNVMNDRLTSGKMYRSFQGNWEKIMEGKLNYLQTLSPRKTPTCMDIQITIFLFCLINNLMAKLVIKVSR